MAALILVANPGSSSRKYALFDGEKSVMRFTFETDQVGQIAAAVETDEGKRDIPNHIIDIRQAADLLAREIKRQNISGIQAFALRVVAPSSYYQAHRWFDQDVLESLQQLQQIAPLHITGTLTEHASLRRHWPHMPIAAISDSAFHAGWPEWARFYGLPLEDAEAFDLRRFGYHGLSMESAVDQLKRRGQLLPRAVICHIGSGCSVTAVEGGMSIDNTMGYSPLEGVIMATRSGSVDYAAVRVLKSALGLDDDQIEEYLNGNSGLLGLSGASNDMRHLLEGEDQGNERSALTVQLFIYRLRQAAGQMSAALGGADQLVLTGTIGERSNVIRERLISRLGYLGFQLDEAKNQAAVKRTGEPTDIAAPGSRPITVVAVQEEAQMALNAQRLLESTTGRPPTV